jgi:hypothetical protein
MRWTSRRHRALGYVLLTASGLLLTVIVMTRPSFGLAVVALAVVLGLLAAILIWRASVLDERS